MNKSKLVFLVITIVALVIILLAYRPSPPATVSTLSIVDNISSASAVLAGTKTVNWQTANYPAGVGVNINLIRKISDSPKQFTLVRTLATDTPNDGQETWTPQEGESSDDLYVEVTCSNAHQFKLGCSSLLDPIKVN